MRRWVWLSLLGLALAASGVRVIQVEGGRLSGDLRYGPWTFEGEVRGRVKDLEIRCGPSSSPGGLASHLGGQGGSVKGLGVNNRKGGYYLVKMRELAIERGHLRVA